MMVMATSCSTSSRYEQMSAVCFASRSGALSTVHREAGGCCAGCLQRCQLAGLALQIAATRQSTHCHLPSAWVYALRGAAHSQLIAAAIAAAGGGACSCQGHLAARGLCGGGALGRAAAQRAGGGRPVGWAGPRQGQRRRPGCGVVAAAACVMRSYAVG